VDKKKLAGLMAAADVGMQILANIPAFYYGTSPNKFFDYIASGLPVLNNYPGWVADMIRESDCGFVVAPGDPQAFADALERAASDRAALKEMGLQSASLAKERFDRQMLADRWVKWVIGGKFEACA
jgi:glycosyltransferase involved in cell wall biosynthesis